MDVKQHSVLFYSTSNMQLAHMLEPKLVEKGVDAEIIIVCVAFQIVHVDEQATAARFNKCIEERCIRVVRCRFRKQPNDVLEQEWQAVPGAQRQHTLTDKIERLLGSRQRQHRAKVLAIDIDIAQMFAVPQQRHTVHDLVE